MRLRENAVMSSDMTPIDDIRSTAAYRRAVFARILFHALRERGLRVAGSA